MRKTLWLLFGLLVAGAVVASAFVLFTPKIGTATRAEIDAVLPASLKVQDPPDPAAEARYARLAALVRTLDERDLSAAQGTLYAPGGGKPPDFAALARLLTENQAVIDGVEAILREGPIRYPRREADTLFKDSPKLKSLARVLALAMKDATARGDRAGCARLAVLGLRYGRALLDGGGVVIDSLVAVAADATAVRAVYEADTAGGFDAPGREAVLAQLPGESGALPQLGAAVRRDFQAMFLPVLVDPKAHFGKERVYGVADNADGTYENLTERPAGTFDPVATARLAGAAYAEGVDAAARPGAGPGPAAKRAEAEAAGLPQRGEGPDLWYRLRMNMGRNTLGRQLVGEGIVFDGLATAAGRRASNRNLLRAVLLLRMGRPAALADPYGKGDLRVDAKRRIVWSVGEDGKDDGGDIGTRLGERAPDLGYRF